MSAMDINKEEVFDQLQQFEEKYADGKIPESLENYLKHIAKTGDILFPWPSIKPLLRKKVEIVLDEFNEKAPISAASCPNFNFEETKQEIIKNLDSFYGAPFTIQRICELLTVPNKHYKRTDKFMRGLEKNVLVVSHVDPKLSTPNQSLPTVPKSIFSTEPFGAFGSDGDYHSNCSSSSNSRSSILDPFDNPEPGTSSGSMSAVNLNCSSSSTSSAMNSSNNSNGNKIIIPTVSIASNSPAPLQQLDSFTTVFSSPPSTPLAVVTNMAPFESASSSSSGSSSSDGSSTGDSSPRPLDETEASPEGTKEDTEETTTDQSPPLPAATSTTDEPMATSDIQEPQTLKETEPKAAESSDGQSSEAENVTTNSNFETVSNVEPMVEGTTTVPMTGDQLPPSIEMVSIEPSSAPPLSDPILEVMEVSGPKAEAVPDEPVVETQIAPLVPCPPTASEVPSVDDLPVTESSVDVNQPKTVLETLPSIDV